VNGARLTLAAVLAIVGVVWIGQGVGVIPGSFMTSDTRWAIAGAVLLAAAVAVLWSARRSSR
jgi:hypothetical protein